MKIRKIHENFKKIGKAKAHPGLAFGTNFAGGMALLCFIGYRMDQHYETGYAWTLTGAILGLIFGAYELWKVVRWIQAREARRLEENEDL